ncbi:MAG: hypothetical protein L0H20_13825 [Corynebacterium sp.]|uniref:hypothetical protein n=1 Tax=Corynebacterium sp. TaxID=1720 RepID=UPI00264801E2|nr:hypothetical protein [Corynebacterium sp.]MDN5724049.1 hypothetical protein [Corynebacterium sp.]
MTTTVQQFITPGLDDVRAGYEHLRVLGVDATTAADWLADHIQTVIRDDLTEQVARAYGRPSADGSTDTEHRRMRRALQTAVKVYNRGRSRLTVIDERVVTQSGAAAVNRAAVLREMNAPTEAPAFLGRANAQAITSSSGRTINGFEVAGRLHIPTVGLRAFVARFEASPKGGGSPSAVRLHDFQVIY